MINWFQKLYSRIQDSQIIFKKEVFKNGNFGLILLFSKQNKIKMFHFPISFTVQDVSLPNCFLDINFYKKKLIKFITNL